MDNGITNTNPQQTKKKGFSFIIIIVTLFLVCGAVYFIFFNKENETNDTKTTTATTTQTTTAVADQKEEEKKVTVELDYTRTDNLTFNGQSGIMFEADIPKFTGETETIVRLNEKMKTELLDLYLNKMSEYIQQNSENMKKGFKISYNADLKDDIYTITFASDGGFDVALKYYYDIKNDVEIAS